MEDTVRQLSNALPSLSYSSLANLCVDTGNILTVLQVRGLFLKRRQSTEPVNLQRIEIALIFAPPVHIHRDAILGGGPRSRASKATNHLGER